MLAICRRLSSAVAPRIISGIRKWRRPEMCAMAQSFNTLLKDQKIPGGHYQLGIFTHFENFRGRLLMLGFHERP